MNISNLFSGYFVSLRYNALKPKQKQLLRLGCAAVALTLTVGAIPFLMSRAAEGDDVSKSDVTGADQIDAIFKLAIDAQINADVPLLKLKTLELLLFLGKVDFDSLKDMPAYLNHAQAMLAKKVHQMLVSDLSAHLTLEQLSEELHSSPTAIKNVFKIVYGESIRDYMKSYRLNEAKRLLKETELPVAEVAAIIGYQNPGHFSAAFKGKYGVLPGEYKKSVQFEH